VIESGRVVDVYRDPSSQTAELVIDHESRLPLRASQGTCTEPHGIPEREGEEVELLQHRDDADDT